MKRLLILGLVIFGISYLFSDEEPVSEIEPQEEVTQEEEATEENVSSESSEEVEVEVETEVKAETKSKRKWTRRKPRRRYSQASQETVKAPAPVETTITETPTKTLAQQQVVQKTPEKNLPTTRVKVYLYEWEIDFSRSSVPEGTVQFEVQNNGLFSHEFALADGQNFGKVKPGETRVFEAKVSPGHCRAYSPKDIDVQNDMGEDFVVYEF